MRSHGVANTHLAQEAETKAPQGRDSGNNDCNVKPTLSPKGGPELGLESSILVRITTIPRGKFTLIMEPSDTIECLKVKIESKTRIPVLNQELICNCKFLANENSLSYCGVIANSRVVVLDTRPKTSIKRESLPDQDQEHPLLVEARNDGGRVRRWLQELSVPYDIDSSPVQQVNELTAQIKPTSPPQTESNKGGG